MNLKEAQEGIEYIIKQIDTDDTELNAFLFSLGCYSGEPITVVSRRRRGCVVSTWKLLPSVPRLPRLRR